MFGPQDVFFYDVVVDLPPTFVEFENQESLQARVRAPGVSVAMQLEADVGVPIKMSIGRASSRAGGAIPFWMSLVWQSSPPEMDLR